MTNYDDIAAAEAVVTPTALPTHVYELLSLDYAFGSGVRTLGIHATVEGAKAAFKHEDKDGKSLIRWEEGVGDQAWFAEIGDKGVTLTILERELLP